MTFDTVIIGGGLSGLISGIRLLQNKKKCAIISSGQSALHFFSGSFDLLNFLPNGEKVAYPQKEINKLIKNFPEHPYTKLGENEFNKLTEQAEQLLKQVGLHVQGSSEKNHFRITPLGELKPTWLTMPQFAITHNDSLLPWKKVCLINIKGFLDFHPEFVSEAFKAKGVKTEIQFFDLPELDRIRKNPSEFRSTNLSIILDKESSREKMIEDFSVFSKNSDALILPDCWGHKNSSLLSDVMKEIGKPIFLLPTFPPSLIGVYTQQFLKDCFTKLGGTYMLGDSVTEANIKNNRVTEVFTKNHGNIPFKADNVILSSGSFFSQGIIADMNKVYEPVFSLDTDFLEKRSDWYNRNLFENQKYQQFGVKTDNNFKGLKNGKPIDNLFVTGAILNGFNPIKEGCGAGVSILTALYVANQILIKEQTYESAGQ